MRRALLLIFLGLASFARGGEIHDAAAKGDVARIKAILAKDKNLVHARDYALRRALLQLGARPSARDKLDSTPLYLACSIIDPEIDARLGKKPDVRPLTEEDRQTRLQNQYTASLRTEMPARKLEIVRLLLAAGASPDDRIKDSTTASNMARKFGTPEIVKLLEEAQRNRAKSKPR